VATDISARDLLKQALKREVAPLLRSHDFKGTAPTWTRVSERGDVAVVNVQSSSWSTRSNLSFYVNLAVAPEPWLAWGAARFGRLLTKGVKESDGLWRKRLDPTPVPGGRDCWTISDAGSAAVAMRDVAFRLEAEGLPRIEPLLNRAQMLEALRSGTLGELPRTSYAVYYEMALAVVLSDDGSSPELVAVLESLKARVPEVDSWNAQRQALLRWVADRLATRTA